MGKYVFTVQADCKETLEAVIKRANSQFHADFKLTEFKICEVGLATLEVSEDLVKPEVLFWMGKRYATLYKAVQLNFTR